FSGGTNAHFACGSNTGLRGFGNLPMQVIDEHDLRAEIKVRAGQKVQVGLQFIRPEETAGVRMSTKDGKALQAHYKETLNWWKSWAAKFTHKDGPGVNIVRSAVTLKGLTFAPTGAIIAAPTPSLPERVGGERNWDYRYCWI